MTGIFQASKVKIRMYRPGLGDCFLLTFDGQDGDKRYMMIDCGILQQTQNEVERLLKIVQDIKIQTGGSETQKGKLHIVVATHEHADHLAGFNYHLNLFTQQFDIDEVWMPWTENKDDPDVSELYATARKIPLDALRSAIEEWKSSKDARTPDYIKKIMDFIALGQMDCMKTLGKLAPRYLHPDASRDNPDPDGPSTVIQREDFGEIRFHVLGPPNNVKDITRNDLPKTKNQLRMGETLNQATSLATALVKRNPPEDLETGDNDNALALDLEEVYNLCLPFDKTRGMPIEQATHDPFFIKHYGFSDQPPHGPEWRRINTDWLEPAAELALDLDSDVNNTSLVLAIELSPGGDVLLFPGDAQYGNWLSWVNTKKGKDILNRTAFYKVGHHGSHNATLVPGGLEQMMNQHLVAMIPVDPARQPSWRMPNPELSSRLLEKTRGRLIIACQGGGETPPCACPAIDFTPPADKPATMTDQEWKQYRQSEEWQAFIQSIDWDQSPDRLWVEYTYQA